MPYYSKALVFIVSVVYLSRKLTIMIAALGLLTVLLIIDAFLIIIACIVCSGYTIGFWGGFFLSIFFTPPVAVICAFISGPKNEPSVFEKAVIERIDTLIKLQKEKQVLEESR